MRTPRFASASSGRAAATLAVALAWRLLLVQLLGGCAAASDPAGPAERRPDFGTYKDVTVQRAPGSAALLTILPGAPTPVVRALPARQPSVSWAFATGECDRETWGGAPATDFAATNVPAFVAAGRHYIVSTGGQAGQFSCGSDDAFERFLARYASPMLEGIDFDIEGTQTEAQVDAIVSRVAAARARHPALRWSFTIATLGGERPNALAPIGDTVMGALRRHGLLGAGVEDVRVNLMTMDYGTADAASCIVGADGRCDMGRSAIHAAERLHADWGVPWSRIELTPMIGGNDSPGQAFEVKDVAPVAAFVRERGLAGVRFWSLDRDVDCPPGPASNACNTVGNAGTFGFANRFLDALGY